MFIDSPQETTQVLFVIGKVVITLFITLAISIPLAGVLIRYRANHNPKAVQLEDTENAVPVHTGPIVNGYFAMMARVYRMEGWSGLYKGTMPTLLTSTFIIVLAALLLIEGPGAWNGHRKTPRLRPLGMLTYSVVLLIITIPATILTYRSVVTPYKLPFFGPRRSLRVLFTPTERSRPWVLYLTPGLFIAQFLHLGLFMFGLTPLQRLLLPTLTEIQKGNPKISPFKLAFYIVLVVVSTGIFTPLEVVITRLSLQRNHRASSENESSIMAAAEETTPTYTNPEAEEVIGLRNEADPYLSFVDCIKRLAKEEGWGSLFRAWWWTTISVLAGGFAA